MGAARSEVHDFYINMVVPDVPVYCGILVHRSGSRGVYTQAGSLHGRAVRGGAVVRARESHRLHSLWLLKPEEEKTAAVYYIAVFGV